MIDGAKEAAKKSKAGAAELAGRSAAPPATQRARAATTSRA
jgi:hypothetical protein